MPGPKVDVLASVGGRHWERAADETAIRAFSAIYIYVNGLYANRHRRIPCHSNVDPIACTPGVVGCGQGCFRVVAIGVKYMDSQRVTVSSIGFLNENTTCSPGSDTNKRMPLPIVVRIARLIPKVHGA